MTTTPREFQNELNKLDDPAYTKGPLILTLKQMANGAKIGDFAAGIFATSFGDEEERVPFDYPRLSKLKTLEELNKELRKIADDHDFHFKRFRMPDQCYSFAKEGPNVKRIEDMTDGQKRMAEMLLSAYANFKELKQREGS
jgi:hypothetical protein